MQLGPRRLSRRAYWLLGWLLTVASGYAVTVVGHRLGLATPVVPGLWALLLGLALCGAGLVLARRFGHTWAGVPVAGLGVLSVGLGLANLLR